MNDPHASLRFLTPRNLLGVWAGLCLYLGIYWRNPQLLFIGTASFLALLSSIWQASRMLRDVRIARHHTARAFEGQFVHVSLELESKSKAREHLVMLEDYFPPGEALRVKHLIRDSFTRGERINVEYLGEIVHRRGLYTLGPVRLEAYDPMGIIKRKLKIETFTSLLVYPSAVDLHMTELLGDGTLAHVGIETTRRPGRSTEYTGLRQYRIGDSPNTIHWRSTARVGHLMVKEFQEDMMTHVSIFIDIGRLGLTGLGDQTSIEYAIKAAASLAKRAIENAHYVQVFAVGTEIEHIPLGSGSRHLLMILDRLAFLKAQGDSVFPETVLHYTPLLKPGGTVILVLSLTTLSIDTIEPLIAALLYRRLLPVVVLIDDRAFIKLYREQETSHSEGLSIEDAVKYLTAQGVRVHLVTKAKSPKQALLQGLERSCLADEY